MEKNPCDVTTLDLVCLHKCAYNHHDLQMSQGIKFLPSSPYVQCVFDDNTAQQILSVKAKLVQTENDNSIAI